MQINTFNPTLGPVDMEKQVTFPVETALAGIPGLTLTRSLTRNGFSQVTAVFTDDTNIYFARQQVTERLAQARDSLPAGVQPNLAPLSTGLGEIFFYSVAFRHPDGKGVKIENGKPGWQSDGSYLTPEGEKLTTELAKAAYLRTVQDWIIRPQMRTVQGVAGVDSNGGYVKQYLVQPNLNAPASYGLSITELADSLERANPSAGSNYIPRPRDVTVRPAQGPPLSTILSKPSSYPSSPRPSPASPPPQSRRSGHRTGIAAEGFQQHDKFVIRYRRQ